MRNSNLAAAGRRFSWIREKMLPGINPCSRAKTGEPVPLHPPTGTALHSLYDPRKEAQKVLGDIKAPCVGMIGLAGGYYLEELLERPDLEAVFLWLLPHDLGILDHRDMSTILDDPRVIFLQSPQELNQWYYPHIMGDFSLVSNAQAQRCEPEFHKDLMSILAQVTQGIALDQSTQGRLGRSWMAHTCKNLENITEKNWTFPTGRSVWVCGAGPSLEEYGNTMNPEDFVLCADTASAYLDAQGQKADLVLAMDCQYWTTLHFLPQSDPPPVLADLSLFPPLGRSLVNVLFFFSAHPLHTWLKTQGVDLPQVETRSGNVGAAALALAQKLSPQETKVCGLDFSYPHGKTYAKDTYQYHYLGKTANRLSPLETGLAELIFRDSGTRLIDASGPRSPVYQSPVQAAYSRDLTSQTWDFPVTFLGGENHPAVGKKIRFQPLELSSRPGAVSDLIRRYYTGLQEMVPERPFLPWYFSLKAPQRALWNSLSPYLVWRKFHQGDDPLSHWPIILKELRTLLNLKEAT